MPSIDANDKYSLKLQKSLPTSKVPAEKMTNHSLSNSESDSEFEDTNIETPLTLRETSRSYTDGIYVRTTTTIPLRDEPASAPTKLSTPIRSRKRKALVSFSDEEREFIRNEKLISDENVFGPRPQVGSPARRMKQAVGDSGFLLTSRLDTIPAFQKDMEFDPSDRDLPEKRDIVNGNNRVVSPKKPLVDEAYKQQVTRTPQRRSPLRKEIIPSSSSIKSAAEEVAEEIARSGAFRSKSTQEIIDQINTSIDKMRESEGLMAPSLEDESEEEILKSLDSYLPKSDRTQLDGSPSRSRTKEVTSSTPLLNFSRMLPSKLNSTPKFSEPVETRSELQNVEVETVAEKEQVQQPESPVLEGLVESLSRKLLDDSSAKDSHADVKTTSTSHKPVHEPPEHDSRQRTTKLASSNRNSTGKRLSGKYARDILRRRHQTSKNYESWLYDRWDKLKRLVELSVPNNVLINNELVLKELGCKDKDELAQRIRFLVRHKK